MTIKTLALAAALAALTAKSGFAATVKLNVVGGQLLGASNVEVNGKLFDVEFVDGTCVTIFDGCDEGSDFDFSTKDEAKAATRSLSDSVLIDSPLGDFDSNPDLIAGIYANKASIGVPYRLDTVQDSFRFSGFENRNANSNLDDFLYTGSASRFFDSSRNDGVLDSTVFARFTPTPLSTVPLPAGGFLLLAGLAGLGALRARSKAVAIR